VNPTTAGERTGMRGQEAFGPLGYRLTPGERRPNDEIFELEPGPPPSLWECGNRAPWFLARFPSAVGSVEKSRPYLRTLYRRRTDFSTLSTARHFHSEYCGTAELLGCINGGRKILFR
jgi:hypothetical protein